MNDLADRFFRAIEEGDIETVKSIYAADAKIWHNNDEIEQSPEENLKVLNWLTRHLHDRHYDVKRRAEIPGGFVQQHVLKGTLSDGKPFAMPACIVCEVKDGQITRLDEYLDPAQAEPLAKAAEASA